MLILLGLGSAIIVMWIVAFIVLLKTAKPNRMESYFYGRSFKPL